MSHVQPQNTKNAIKELNMAEMSQEVNVPAIKFNPQNPHSGRRELTPIGCPL